MYRLQTINYVGNEKNTGIQVRVSFLVRTEKYRSIVSNDNLLVRGGETDNLLFISDRVLDEATHFRVKPVLL